MPTVDELAGLYRRSVKGQYHVIPLITLSDSCPWASDSDSTSAGDFCDDRRFNGVNPVYGNTRALPVRSDTTASGSP